MVSDSQRRIVILHSSVGRISPAPSTWYSVWDSVLLAPLLRGVAIPLAAPVCARMDAVKANSKPTALVQPVSFAVNDADSILLRHPISKQVGRVVLATPVAQQSSLAGPALLSDVLGALSDLPLPVASGSLKQADPPTETKLSGPALEAEILKAISLPRGQRRVPLANLLFPIVKTSSKADIPVIISTPVLTRLVAHGLAEKDFRLLEVLMRKPLLSAVGIPFLIPGLLSFPSWELVCTALMTLPDITELHLVLVIRTALLPTQQAALCAFVEEEEERFRWEQAQKDELRAQLAQCDSEIQELSAQGNTSAEVLKKASGKRKHIKDLIGGSRRVVRHTSHDTPLDALLNLIVSRLHSTSHLQQALRTLDVTAVLQLLLFLHRWLRRYLKMTSETVTDSFGTNVPTLSQVLEWAVLLIDAHGLSLIRLPHGAPLLRAVKEALVSHQTVLAASEPLLGVLTQLVPQTESQETTKRGSKGKPLKPQREGKASNAGARKTIHAVPDYTVELVEF
eukprot:TRINITY_DN5293_c0_g1_i1.p1 TRINITY_DN5293_c0_g1~~TRINITY_DN5293_c0_g1_i1.p1  ORF type:complete len:510 (-),score=109.48 TRINITY_DN5293_c0_g1_i1:8-1537(-)